MSNGQDFEEKERERKIRRKVFYLTFGVLTLVLGGFLIWKLSILILPIIVGALLAFVFRPVKERFRIRWLPHELQVLCSFAAIGLALFFAFNTLRKHIPDEEQKLEFKVRLQYKLNEKYQQLVARSPEGKSNTVGQIIEKQLGPLMNKVNQSLELNPKERDLFLKYAAGYNDKPPIEKKFVAYFWANQKTGKYVVPEESPAETAPPVAPVTAAPAQAPPGSEGASLENKLSAWMLAPLIFIFLGFDNGQIRRFLIGLVPNLYFELSLTVLDRLDDALGKYLRGTLLECLLVGLTLMVGLIVLGSAVNVHPLVVIIAIVGGSLLMGLWGMLFAIPTVVVIKTVVATFFKELKDYRII